MTLAMDLGCSQLWVGKNLEFQGDEKTKEGAAKARGSLGSRGTGPGRTEWAVFAGAEEAQRGGDPACQERRVQPVHVWQRTAGSHEHAEGALP